jgi:hypothetical protein
MWQEFKPLWIGMRATGGRLLVAGGYGLFLKQHWLRSNAAVPIIVPLPRWGDSVPRVTKDLDLVVGLDIISAAQSQQLMAIALRERGFEAKHPRWQFEKKLDDDRSIIVDLHAAVPASKHPNLQMDKLRVKHKPSLGEDGIHGRQNPEAIGGDRHSFGFDLEGVEIAVPHPVSWCVMKLTAMRDRWAKGDDQSRPQDDRASHRDQAIKHARDVFRIVAMTTRDERDQAVEVLETVRAQQSFVDAVGILRQFFEDNDGWGNLVVRDVWRPDDQELIRSTLEEWFR